MTTVVAVQTSEDGAKEYWAKFERAGRLATIEGRSALFVASAVLASVVADLLSEQGLTVNLDRVRVAPARDYRAGVMALVLVHGGEPVVVPIIPASAELRVYPMPSVSAEVGERVVAAVTVPAEQVESDGWVPAAAIGGQLHAALTDT